MENELFWTAFGAIGGTLGAVATAVAVIVALWQTKLNYKKKLKLSFSDSITIVPETGSKFYKYVGLTITNIGNRDVVINNWGFYLNDDSVMLVVADTSPIGRLFQTNLPHRLQIEESISLYYDKSKFESVISECVEKGTLTKTQKILFFTTDSTGKKHKIKSDKTVEYYLSKISK